MGEKNESDAITKQDIAQFIKETHDRDSELTAYERAAASTAWAIWDSIAEQNIDHDLTEEEAERILSQFPLGQDESLELGK